MIAACALLAWGLAQQGSEASANLVDAEAVETTLGTVTLSAQEGDGVVATLNIDANDVIAPGEHAIHIHETGDCAPADSDDGGTQEAASAAGGHFDPTDVGHGKDNGPHVGDSAEYNYAFADDGSFEGEVAFPLATLDGDQNVLDEDGAALVIHEGTDDMETDPSGESGPRVACAAFAAP